MRNPLLFKYGIYLPTTLIVAPRFKMVLHELNRTQRWPKERLHDLQLSSLRDLIRRARDETPHYSSRLAGLDLSSIQSLTDVRRLPFTTKDLVKSDPGRFVSRDPGRFLTWKTTGGSTGQPMTVPKTREAMAWELGGMWRGYGWAGADVGDRQARFWGVPADDRGRWRAALTDFISNRRRCSAFDFDDRALLRYFQELQSFRPSWFYGYASMLVEFARFCRERNLQLGYDLKCVVSTSEVLTTSHRIVMEDTFSTRVFNEYGCGELGTIAHECEEGSLHLSDENFVVEFLDGDEPVGPGTPAEMVITELHNRAMPLIRYRTGDFASWSDSSCVCGRSLTVIKDVFGRAYDLLRNPSGRLFHAEFMMYIFEDAKRQDLGIGQFQVVQTAPDSFRIKVIPTEAYGPRTEAFITRRIRESFYPKTTVAFERVHSIPREPSGKMRLIVGYRER